MTFLQENSFWSLPLEGATGRRLDLGNIS